MLLRCENLEPPMSQLGHSLQVRPRPLVHKCPLCINTDRKFWALGFVAMCQELPPASHSITSSASASNVLGTVKPSTLAVLRFMMSSNFVGCSTGISAGFAPFRIFVNKLRRATVHFSPVHSVRNQSASFYKILGSVNRRKSNLCCKIRDLLA